MESDAADARLLARLREWIETERRSSWRFEIGVSQAEYDAHNRALDALTNELDEYERTTDD